MSHVHRFAGRRVTFGESPAADVRATEIEDLGLDGTRARIVTRSESRLFHVPLLGRAQLANVLCATAVGLEMGVDLDAIAHRIESLKPSAHRGAVLRLRHGITVLDDSYNSSPAALKRSLQTLASVRAPRRGAGRGEMLELGDRSTALHPDCGDAAARSGLGLLVTIGGPSAKALGEAAIAAGVPEDAVHHFATSDAAAGDVTLRVSDGDVVLVKGSRGTRTDRVVEMLEAAYR
jgi:UDP-N-acetylmuramoyl-tripeptide--D-alanyl-D-alanine ligase